MLSSAALPPEFQFESEWSSPVVFRAAHTQEGWLVAASQHGVRAVLALFDPELELVRTRVVASGKECNWRSIRPLTLPDGRCLLSVTSSTRANFELDLQTLEHAAPPAWTACGGKGSFVTSLAVLGERIILGIGDSTRTGRFMSMPVGAKQKPTAFFKDFAKQITSAGILFASERSAFEAMTTLGPSLLLTHRDFLKTKSVGHALLAVDSAGKLAQLRNMRAKPERARFSEDLQWFADRRRKLALLYGGRVLEAVDAKLASRERLDGHALFKALIPVAADGGGGMLWYSARAARLVATSAAEIDPRELANSIAQLAGRYQTAAVPKRAARPARATASRIARPTLDLARLDDDYYRETRDTLLAIANGTYDGTPIHAWTRAGRGVLVAAVTSAVEPGHPAIAVGTRLAAQASTGQIAEKLGRGSDEVSFPVGAYTVTRTVRFEGTNAWEWNEAWMRATISRDRASLDFLEARHDPSFVTAGEDYRFPLRTACIAVRSEPARAIQAIERARELARPQHVRYEERTEIAALRAPLFPMLRALAARNEQAFERALLDALAAHKKFYSTPSRRLSEHGIIAWSPLALSCIARDLELRFEAQTEYLPKVLL